MQFFVFREWIPIPRVGVAVVRPEVSFLNQPGDLFEDRDMFSLSNQPSGRIGRSG